MRATIGVTVGEYIARRFRQLEQARREDRALILDLVEALHQHARTDAAPDAAIPYMRKLAQRARRLARRP